MISDGAHQVDNEGCIIVQGFDDIEQVMDHNDQCSFEDAFFVNKQSLERAIVTEIRSLRQRVAQLESTPSE